MDRARFPLVISLLVLLNPMAFAFADIPDLTWEDSEVVDSPVHEVSSASGVSVLF